MIANGCMDYMIKINYSITLKKKFFEFKIVVDKC
jgi:hypothetical protein